MDLYNSLYSNRPGTEGTLAGVRPIEEIGSGGGTGDPEPYQPFGHGARSPGLAERVPDDGGSGSGSGTGGQAFFSVPPAETPAARDQFLTRSGVDPEALAMFRLLYGDRGLQLLEAFARANGKVVVEDIWDWGKDSWKSDVDYWHRGDFKVQLDTSLNPAERAEHLYRQLSVAIGYKDVRDQLVGMNVASDGLDEQGWALIQESYRQSIREAASTARMMAELYVEGIVSFSAGGNLAVVLYDLSEGRWADAVLGLAPGPGIEVTYVAGGGVAVVGGSAALTRWLRRAGELEEFRHKLRTNLGELPAGWPAAANPRAHHIFPVTLFDTELARRLDKWGIDLNGIENGMWLPYNDFTGWAGAVHRGRHSRRYNEFVEDYLSLAQNKEDALRMLDDIRGWLEDGTLDLRGNFNPR